MAYFLRGENWQRPNFDLIPIGSFLHVVMEAAYWQVRSKNDDGKCCQFQVIALLHTQ